MVLLEVCIDSVAGALAACAAGAQRVELCSNLLEGGTTPSHGMIQQVQAVLRDSVQLMVLIRPRGGDFVYSSDELQVMLADMRACKQLGAYGVVFGCLQPDGRVDMASTAQLVRAATDLGLDMTFHRAFDASRDLSEALDDIVALGIPRVLTSGGCATAQQGCGVLSRLVQQAAGRISILAGGGVRARNVAAVVSSTGVQEVHSAARRRHCSAMRHRRLDVSLCSSQPPSDFEWSVTDGAEVAALLSAANSAAAPSW